MTAAEAQQQEDEHRKLLDSHLSAIATVTHLALQELSASDVLTLLHACETTIKMYERDVRSGGVAL